MDFAALRSADELQDLPSRATVLVPSGQQNYLSLVAICDLMGHSVLSTAPCREGGVSLANIERFLAEDRFDEIDAIILDSVTETSTELTAAVRAIMDRCWHNADLIVPRVPASRLANELREARRAA